MGSAESRMVSMFYKGLTIPEIAEVFSTTGLHVARVLISKGVDIKR
jgi:hypothetical protein